MDWFERLTGFRETNYAETRAKLSVNGDRLRSVVNGRSYRIGALDLTSLEDLRSTAIDGVPRGRLKVGIVSGDVRRMHALPEFAGALFQVASQFNLLEMISFDVTPEDGVTRYANDPTQGPACAIACGAATIYRNYFAPVGEQRGQTREHQLDGLVDLGAAISNTLSRPVDGLWAMRNGYALCTPGGLEEISNFIARSEPEVLDGLRAKLRIGLHRDIEVTDTHGKDFPIVSQAFCSALPVRYGVASPFWGSFARLILEAAYEATIWAGVENLRRGASNIVLLTQLGGGAFGNEKPWIDSAIRRALNTARDMCLDVRLVSYGNPSEEMRKLAMDFG